MSNKKPIRRHTPVWRIRGADGRWRELPENELPKMNTPGYVWAPFIVEHDGLRILHFIIN